MNIVVVPIDANLVSKRQELSIAINSFLNANLPNAPTTDKAWAVYSEDGEAVRILGFAGCNLGNRFADIPVFYIEPGTDRQGKWAAAKATEALTSRMAGFIADVIGFGTQVLIRIEPQQEQIWNAFVERLGAVKGERFLLEV